MSVNRVILLGNLGKDPEVRMTQNQKEVANFSVATTEKWDGNEKTTWHDIVVWGKLAGICSKYLKKGSKVYLEGKLQKRSYEKNGNTVWVTEVVADQMRMLDSRPQGQGGAPDDVGF